ncbi:MAG TPA: type III-B CRISPR module RAMP protein Cmr6 [Methanothrix sp.]|nr:type III-B CRISPR module RAMP protein Cmr6 [Methanothrix sp.]
MTDACRKEISDWWNLSRTGANASLLHDRFLQVANGDENENHPEARRKLFDAMIQSLVQSKDVYAAAYQRQESALKDLKSKGLFSTDGRMVIGLGGENVLETGLTLNHTYGTPLIPGTALKGLAAHYCNQAWGAADDRFKLGGEYHQAIFGSTEDSGHIIFYDAWITPESLVGSLQPDVITPHHGEYYSKGLTAPTDFDDPNPVTFLSVVGTFCVAVSCDVPGPDGDEWAEKVFELLSDALREWGIGGKTNAGYGRLVKVDREREGIPEKKEGRPSPLKREDPDARVKDAPIAPGSIKKIPKYRKGDIVEVTKVPDPNERRGAAYFRADDGLGGLVVLGTPPSVEIGQKTQLQINGVMEKEGLYNFAAIGAKKEPTHKPRDGRRRR